MVTPRLFVAFLTVLTLATAPESRADIPASERQVLLDLYNGTNGPSWADNGGWGLDPGTECGWAGIVCSGDHVGEIDLCNNNLTGSIAAVSFGDLPGLYQLALCNNAIAGTIPSLSTSLNLVYVDLSGNQFSGGIPSLPNNANLLEFYAYNNQLTGPIPEMPIPSGGVLISEFRVQHNQLSGSIPSPLKAGYFDASFNNLSGPLPLLHSPYSVFSFNVANNSLSGGITDIPDNLDYFIVSNNHLTGSIPSPLPITVSQINVDGNELTGDPPAIYANAELTPGASSLCPNALNAVESAVWDQATGQSPWYQDCVARPDLIFVDGFDS